MSHLLPAKLRATANLHGDSLKLADNSAGASQQENWKSFDSSSEAGRLLAKLYGNQYKPQIQYPQLKKRNPNSMPHNSGWHPTGKANNVDPRTAKFNKKKANSVNVPSVGRTQRQQFAAVDLVPKRKSAASCQAALDAAAPKMAAYRPPNMHAYSSDFEKDRLAEVFTHKGGKALPDDLTHMVSDFMPSEIKQRQAESERVEKAQKNRRMRLNGGIDPQEQPQRVVSKELDPKDQLFTFIYDEIVERRNHQNDMEEAGCTGAQRQDAARGIASRISRLKQLDAEKAEEAINRLYKS